MSEYAKLPVDEMAGIDFFEPQEDTNSAAGSLGENMDALDIVQQPSAEEGNPKEEDVPDQAVLDLDISRTRNLVPEEGGGTLRQYLNRIGRVALLNAEREVELAKRIEAGLYATHRTLDIPKNPTKAQKNLKADLEMIAAEGQQARNDFIEANLRLVVNVAKKERHRTTHRQPLLDLIQIGNIGLIRAVEKFDYTKGIKFSTYATWWIQQAIGYSRGEAYICRLPTNVSEDVSKLGGLEWGLTRDLGRSPTTQELASKMKKPESDIANLLRYRKDGVFLDASANSEGNAETPFGNFLIDPTDVADVAATNVARQKVREKVRQAIRELEIHDQHEDTRWAVVINRYFGFNGKSTTMADMASEFGVSKQTITNWRNRAYAFLTSRLAAVYEQTEDDHV